jgi:hypothetical protein
VADSTLFVDLGGLETLARRLNTVAGLLDGQDTLTYGLPLGRPRLEECLVGVLADRRRRRAKLDEDIARLAADVRAAGEAYVGVDEAAAAAASRNG